MLPMNKFSPKEKPRIAFPSNSKTQLRSYTHNFLNLYVHGIFLFLFVIMN